MSILLMSFRFSLLVGLVFLTPACVTATGFGAMSEPPDLRLSGMQLRAGAVALEEFQGRGYSLDKYTIYIRERFDQFEVVFVPHHPEGEQTVRGGQTAFGKEIHYLVSRSGDITKISYAK